jgi:hypothetical protein
LPDDADKTLDDEAKATVLGKVIDAAEITGFARVKSPTRPFPNLRLIGKESAVTRPEAQRQEGPVTPWRVTD